MCPALDGSIKMGTAKLLYKSNFISHVIDRAFLSSRAQVSYSVNKTLRFDEIDYFTNNRYRGPNDDDGTSHIPATPAYPDVLDL